MLLNMGNPNPFCDAIRKEAVEHRRNYNIMITGKVQTRKSTTAMSIARGIQTDFDMETGMAIINAKNFLEIFQNKTFKRGQVIVLDEFGIGMNHRQWHSFLNKALNYVMTTYGFRGLIVIVTVPYADFVDCDSRKLFDMQIDMIAKNDKERCAQAIAHTLTWNQKMKKMYYQLPRAYWPDRDNEVMAVRKLNIHYPPDDVMERYFSKANNLKTILASDLKAESDSIERQQIARKFLPDIYVDEILKCPENFYDYWCGMPFISFRKIQNKWHALGVNRAKSIRSAVNAKLKEKGLKFKGCYILDANIQEGHNENNQPDGHEAPDGEDEP